MLAARDALGPIRRIRILGRGQQAGLLGVDESTLFVGFDRVIEAALVLQALASHGVDRSGIDDLAAGMLGLAVAAHLVHRPIAQRFGVAAVVDIRPAGAFVLAGDDRGGLGATVHARVAALERGLRGGVTLQLLDVDAGFLGPGENAINLQFALDRVHFGRELAQKNARLKRLVGRRL